MAPRKFVPIRRRPQQPYTAAASQLGHVFKGAIELWIIQHQEMRRYELSNEEWVAIETLLDQS